jgi:serine/threonine protein kinase
VKIIPRVLYDAYHLPYPPLEADVGLALCHAHIVRVFEVIHERDHIFIIQERLGGGDLFNCMQETGVFSEFLARCCFKDLMAGVSFLHSQGIVHRDLKPENCVLDESGRLKIIDFGLAARFSPGLLFHEFVGSPQYAAPEIVREVPYEGPPIDVWAMGVLLYDMVMGDLPFENNQNVYEISVSDVVSNELSLLLQCILCESVVQRWTMEMILKSEWLNLAVQVSPLERIGLVSSSTCSQLSMCSESPSRESPLHRRLLLEHRRALQEEMGFGTSQTRKALQHKEAK